jgi:uncharacterized protein YjdB
MVAVSEEGTEAWVGNTSGEVYIREVCLEESIALPCVEVPGGYTEDDYYVDSWRYSEQGTDGRLSLWLGDHQETQLKATSSMMTMQADEEHPWEEGAGITVDLTSGLEALFKSITIEVAIMDGAPETWKLQVSTDGGATYADIEGAVATIQKKGETEVLFKRIHLPEPFAYSEYLEHKSEYVPEEHPYRIRMVAVSEEGTKAWVGNTSGEVYIKEVCLEDQVKLPATDDISVSSISVSLDKNLLIRSEEFVQATAEVLPDDANNKEVVWSVSDENVARVDENGKVTRIDRKFTMDSIVSHVVEEVSVIATAADGSGVVGSAVLKVENEGYPLLPYITLDDAQKKANEIYESGQGNYTDESWQAFESAREALNHCEYDGAKLIACIEELEKAEAGLAESELETETESETEVKESETSTQTEKQSESKLEPAKQKVTTIQAAKKITLKKGKTKKLKVAVKNRNGKKITFRSRNPKIAKVSKNGLVTGKKKGTTKILIQCNGKKKTVTVKVK